MIAQILLSALAAASTVASQSSSQCSSTDTITINSAADASAISSCTSIQGNLAIGAGAGQQVDISGPTTISGDLTVSNNQMIISLSSKSLASVSGSFTIMNTSALTKLDFPSLSSAREINWQAAATLTTLQLTTGITKADSVTISDTYLSDLTGIDIQSAKVIDINNNNRLTTYQTSLANVSGILNIQANGANLAVSLPKLVWIANMTIANVTSFDVPSLEVVNGSAKFDFNYFTNLTVTKMTSTSDGTLSFIDNGKLESLSFPSLTSLGGGLVIANNTAIKAINGFPSLKTVTGDVKLRGNFTQVEFPKLSNVQGAFDVSSTKDISDVCNAFTKLAPASQGGNGDIQGTYSCSGQNASANSDTGSGASGNSNNGGSSGNHSSAAGLYVNHALLGIAAVAGFSLPLW